MGTVCLQCGDKGVNNAFVYCVRCLDVAVHRYCLDVIPKTVDEFVSWLCDDCQLKIQKQPVSIQNQSKKKEPFLDVGGHGQSDTSTKTDHIKCAESFTKSCREKFRVLDEKKRLNTSPSQQLEEEKLEVNLTEQNKLLVDTSQEDGPRRRRRLVKVSDKEKDQHVVGNNLCKRPNKGAAAVNCDSIPSSVTRDCWDFFQQPCESDPKPGAVACRNGSFRSSHWKAVISSDSSMDEERQGNVFSRHSQENKWLGLEKNCSDMSTIDHNRTRESEITEERTSACNHKNIISTADCSAPAEPVLEPIWRGSFNIWNRKELVDGLMTHMSSRACTKAYEEAHQFLPVLHLEMLPKSDIWPKSFKTSEPSGEHIALYFFPSDISEKAYDRLVDEMLSEELAMRAIIQSAELLVFTSMELQLPYWRFRGKYYLWGVFRGKQQPSASPSQTCKRESSGDPKAFSDLHPSSEGGRVLMTKKGGCGGSGFISSLNSSTSSTYGCGSC